MWRGRETVGMAIVSTIIDKYDVILWSKCCCAVNFTESHLDVSVVTSVYKRWHIGQNYMELQRRDRFSVSTSSTVLVLQAVGALKSPCNMWMDNCHHDEASVQFSSDTLRSFKMRSYYSYISLHLRPCCVSSVESAPPTPNRQKEEDYSSYYMNYFPFLL